MGGRGEVLARLNQAWVLQTEGRGSLERSSEDGSDRIVVNWTWSERGTEPAAGVEVGMLGGGGVWGEEQEKGEQHRDLGHSLSCAGTDRGDASREGLHPPEHHGNQWETGLHKEGSGQQS